MEYVEVKTQAALDKALKKPDVVPVLVGNGSFDISKATTVEAWGSSAPRVEARHGPAQVQAGGADVSPNAFERARRGTNPRAASREQLTEVAELARKARVEIPKVAWEPEARDAIKRLQAHVDHLRQPTLFDQPGASPARSLGTTTGSAINRAERPEGGSR